MEAKYIKFMQIWSNINEKARVDLWNNSLLIRNYIKNFEFSLLRNKTINPSAKEKKWRVIDGVFVVSSKPIFLLVISRRS